MNKFILRLLVFAVLLLAPATAFAQASITGVVRDSSGAVLPGVTVEAASPVLIEKVRVVVTDGGGQYRIVDLRPGSYTVTFTLTGFNTVRREGITLEGNFTATVNADMPVGALEETLTVTGEAPTVDVQTTARQQVLDKEVIDTVPTGRNQYTLAVLIPGVTVGRSIGGAGTQDVGGALGDVGQQLVVHGSRDVDQRLTIDGLTAYSSEGAGQFTVWSPNMSATQEMTIDVGGGSAESATGGVRMNIIPREGGNRYSGTVFGTWLNSSFQGSNFSDALRDRGLPTPDKIELISDFAPGVGGPIVRDRLWMFTSYKNTKNHNQVAGIFHNANLNNPAAWTYAADTARPAIYELNTWDANVRLTWQASQRNKISAYFHNAGYCRCSGVMAGSSPENFGDRRYPLNRVATVSYSAPLTTRVLIEAGWSNRGELWRDSLIPEFNTSLRDTLADGTQVGLIGVTEQSTGFAYRSITRATFPGFTKSKTYQYKAAVSYVTGSHSFKFGFTDNPGSREAWQGLDGLNNVLNYRLNNGVPNQLTMYAKPTMNHSRIRHDLGLYAQDRWTVGRLTANLGLRFEYFTNYFPESTAGPGLFVPNRNVTFPETDWVNWKDFSPRLGVAYDLFGDGKTAVRASLNRYTVASGLQGQFGAGSHPVGLLAFSVTRSWNDANRNFIPDCVLSQTTANGECGAMSDQNFGGTTRSTTIDPAIIRGWHVRNYNWEFSTGVQRELMPRVAVDVGFFRRSYGNFSVTDNRSVAPSDYSPFQITAPVDPRLPNGGGYVVSGLYNLNPDRVGQIDNFLTSANNFGGQSEVWSGVDVSTSARLANGVLLQGGVSTGRTTSDNCAVAAALDNPSQLYCRTVTNFLTQIKALGSYTIPRIGVQTSATFQSLPGPQVTANYVVSNAVVQQSLGRPLSGGASNVTVNVVEPGTMYGERLNQVDIRVSRAFPFGGTRTSLNLDLYNALNSDTVLVQNNSYAVWQQPQRIINARFFKISAQFDF